MWMRWVACNTGDFCYCALSQLCSCFSEWIDCQLLISWIYLPAHRSCFSRGNLLCWSLLSISSVQFSNTGCGRGLRTLTYICSFFSISQALVSPILNSSLWTGQLLRLHYFLSEPLTEQWFDSSDLSFKLITAISALLQNPHQEHCVEVYISLNRDVT